MLGRTTQDRWVIVESSDKMSSTGGENGKPTPVFLPREPYEEYENTIKIWHWEMSIPGPKVSNMLLGKSRKKAAEKMKRLGKAKMMFSCECVWWWKSDAVKNNITQEPEMLDPWIKVNCKWSNRRGKSAYQHLRNQWNKMDLNGWI